MSNIKNLLSEMRY